MASIRIDAFAGLNLKKDPKKGPFWQAVEARNCDVREGSVDVAYPADQVTYDSLGITPTSVEPLKIYHLTETRWLHWDVSNVEVVPFPVTNNSTKRVVIVGDGSSQLMRP